jgi:hypothetical protein
MLKREFINPKIRRRRGSGEDPSGGFVALKRNKKAPAKLRNLSFKKRSRREKRERDTNKKRELIRLHGVRDVNASKSSSQAHLEE